MKRTTFDAAQVWREIEDWLLPRLQASLSERVVYSHLLRHTRLEGRSRLRCSITWLAVSTGLSLGAARRAVRGLAEKGALRILSRSNATGHLLCLRLPAEIPDCQKRATRKCHLRPRGGRFPTAGTPPRSHPPPRTRPLLLLPPPGAPSLAGAGPRLSACRD